jgi:hypothetical protein
MTTAIVMMDSIVMGSLFKGLLFSVPFGIFLATSTFFTQQASLLVARIDLLDSKDGGEIADEVIV